MSVLMLFRVCALSLLLAAGDGTGDGGPPPVAVVHDAVKVDVLTGREFRRVFLGTQERWADGERVVLVLPPPGSPEMQWLCDELRVSERLYRRGLMEKALRGDIHKPLQARDVKHALELAAATVGAIAPVSPTQADRVYAAGDEVGLVRLGEER